MHFYTLTWLYARMIGYNVREYIIYNIAIPYMCKITFYVANFSPQKTIYVFRRR